MIKIFHLITSIQLGGAEIIAFNLAEHCRYGQSEEIETVIVELHKTENTYSVEKKKELALKNIKTISLSNDSKRLSLLVAPFRLAYYLLKVKPQIIHAQTDLPDFVLSVTLRMLSLSGVRAPQIIRTIQNTELWPTHHKMGKFTENAFSNETIVAVSHASLKAYKILRLKNHLSLSPHQSIIYNAAPSPEKKEHKFKIHKEKINIAFCGRFEHQKGIDILIERIKEIQISFRDKFVFHIIGSGTYYQDVRKLVTTSTNVLMYDAVPNIADKLYDFDYLIMPSRFEGLGIMSIEASLSKVPVIAAIAPGLSETLPPDWPLQFHLDNQEELFSIFRKIDKKEYELEALKNNIYLFVSEKFSHKKMIDEYSKLYIKMNE